MKRMKLGLAFCCVARLPGGGIPGWAQSQPKEEDGWMILADIPHPQVGCSGAVLDNQMHILVGTTLEGGASNNYQVYDPASKRWSAKAPLPDKAGWRAIAVYRGRIYVFGGDNKGIEAPVNRRRKSPQRLNKSRGEKGMANEEAPTRRDFMKTAADAGLATGKSTIMSMDHTFHVLEIME